MYQYQDMNPDEFENLAVEICKNILGEATQGFAKGRDGGRDGKFVGTANSYPSMSKPWTGTTIIQAKHTSDTNQHYSDPRFFSESSVSATLSEEVVKIKKLVDDGELDNYMLFANRKLTGGLEPQIKAYISEHTGLSLENIAVYGINDLDRELSRHKYILDMVNLTPLTKYPNIVPDDLAEIIPVFASAFDAGIKHTNFNPVPRTEFEDKNKLNNMSDEFAKTLLKRYMSYIGQVRDFLSDPQNLTLQGLYQNAVDDFQYEFIIPHKRKLEYFDDVFNELVRLLTSRDYILKKHKNLTRILVFYMYYNCDIGISNND